MTKKSNPNQRDLLFQKVGVFIDAENIELSGLKHHEGRTDYKVILSQIGDREITRIIYYKPIYKEISDTFASFWASLGGEIKRPQKNADSFLIIDAVTLAEKLDVVILVGGDKDFLPLIWYLKSRGCRVEMWSWPEATSPEVMEQVDFYYALDERHMIKEEKKGKPSEASKGSSGASDNSKPKTADGDKDRSAHNQTSNQTGNPAKTQGSSQSNNQSASQSSQSSSGRRSENEPQRKKKKSGRKTTRKSTGKSAGSGNKGESR